MPTTVGLGVGAVRFSDSGARPRLTRRGAARRLVPPEGSDEQWLAHCGTQGRVALTHNSRIRYVPNERAAVKQFNVQLVVVVGQVPTAELARNFVASLLRVEAWLDRAPGPSILKVYRPAPAELARTPDAPGRVELWYPKA